MQDDGATMRQKRSDEYWIEQAQTLKERREYGKAVLYRYKSMKGCKKCGYNKHHAALEFNHRNPQEKLFNISSGKTTMSLSRTAPSKIKLKEEIFKCDILCANCHRIVTFENKHQWKEEYKH